MFCRFCFKCNDKKKFLCRNCFCRNSRPEVFCEKGTLRNFVKFTGKHLCQSLLFNKVSGLRPATSLTKKLWYRCFPVIFAKFLRKSFLQNTSGRLLLLLEYLTFERETQFFSKLEQVCKLSKYVS